MEPDKAIIGNISSNRRDITTYSYAKAINILLKLYDCQFNDFEKMITKQRLAFTNGGPSWNQINSCIGNNGSMETCVHNLAASKCEHAKHRVSKVLRLSTDLLGDLLKKRNNLKVLHLFRDPRAIINSRIHTNWYRRLTNTNVADNAKSLCKKMLFDFRMGKALLKIYPDRFKFIFYEDLNKNPLDKVKIIYKYMGMSLNESKYQHIMNPSLFSTKNNTAFWWRYSLSWDLVQIIDNVCKNVNSELGYNHITNIEDYGNMSVSSIDISKEYLLV